ncbi:MAG: insulinase family protein [Bryobacterales bacterium]|nr:insulinase family protein [Bryobacterales bacterium]
MSKTLNRSLAVETTVLANGLKIITESMPGARSLSMGLWLRSGSRRESAAENGISHFIEHMLFKGTARRGAQEIARELDTIGGYSDAFTGKEIVSFNAKVLDEHAPHAFDILSDMLLHPLFDAADVEKEKGVVLEEIKMDLDSAESQTHELFCKKFWKEDALGWPILGTPKTVKSFTPAILRDYWSRHYVPANLLITAAGKVKHAAFVKMVEAVMGGMKKGKPLPALPDVNVFPQIAMKTKPSLEQAQVCVAAPSYPMGHSKRFGCYLLNTILGGGMSSRLFQRIREQQGLVYHISSELSLYRDSGAMAVYAGTSPATLRRVVSGVMEELRGMKHGPIAAEELRRSKDNLKASIVLGLESPSSRMSNLARQDIFFGRFCDLDETIASIEAVTIADIQEIANTFLKPENMALTVVGPSGTEKFTRRDLAC